MMRLLIGSCLLLILGAAPVLDAQTAFPEPSLQPPQEILLKFEQAEELTLAGEDEKALSLLNEIEQDFIHSLAGYGDHISGIFVRLLLARAISHLDLGHDRLAAWDYAAARQLDPEAVDELSERLGGRMGELPALDWRDHCASPGCGMVRQIGSEGVIPPRKIHAPFPPFPQRERRLGPQIPMRRLPIKVIVQVILDDQGRPHRPEILVTEGGPVFVANTLSVLRNWRFEPARLPDGSPVSVTYNLMVNYTLEKGEGGEK